MNEPRLMQNFTARLFVKVIFTKNTFRKNVQVNLYGYLDVHFIVSVFDPNRSHRSSRGMLCEVKPPKHETKTGKV